MWHASVAPVGRTLTSYVVRATGGKLLTVPSAATAATVTGLAAGHWYAFTVTAVYDDASRITSTASPAGGVTRALRMEHEGHRRAYRPGPQ